MADNILEKSEIDLVVEILEINIENSQDWVKLYVQKKLTRKAEKLDNRINQLIAIVKKLK